MTSRERVLAAMNRDMPDRVPRGGLGFTPISLETFKRNAGGVSPEEYFKADVRGIGYAQSRNPADYRKYFAGMGIDMDRLEIDDFGVGHVKSANTQWHYTHFTSPLRDSDDLNDFIDYPLPDFHEPYRSEHFARQAAEHHARGFAVSGHMEMTLFEKAWQIRGFEKFLADMHERPDIIDCLFDRILAFRIQGAELYAAADVDLLSLGDDVSMQTGMLISPALWRRYLKPRMARIIGAARRVKPGIHVMYHSDGNPSAIYDELLEIGVTVLNPIQPECVDPARVKAEYGDRAAFWGAIGIQYTLPFGSVGDVRNEVKLRMETIGKNGGYIIAPTHVIAPEVPWENLKALKDAIDEFGNYM